MSKRMNKDRAKQELERLKKISEQFLKQNNFREFKNVVTDKSERIMIGKECFYLSPKVHQALDIAIESLQNDDLIKRLENGECCKHSSNKVVAYNRDYLDENLEMEFDILKTTRDTVQAMRKGASDDEVAERLVKVVEPYESKE